MKKLAILSIICMLFAGCRPAKEITRNSDFEQVKNWLFQMEQSQAERLKQTEMNILQNVTNEVKSFQKNERSTENENTITREYVYVPELGEAILSKITENNRNAETVKQITSEEIRSIIQEEFNALFVERETEHQSVIDAKDKEIALLKQDVKEVQGSKGKLIVLGIVIGIVGVAVIGLIVCRIFKII